MIDDEAMKMIYNTQEFTHELLLQVMPFESGYLETEEGKPDQDSVMAAIALRTVEYVMKPATDPYRKPLIN